LGDQEIRPFGDVAFQRIAYVYDGIRTNLETKVTVFQRKQYAVGLPFHSFYRVKRNPLCGKNRTKSETEEEREKYSAKA